MDFLADFGVEPVLLLAQIVNFAILLFILHRFLYKPILKVLDERKKKVEKSIKQSEEIEKRYQEMGEKQSKILEKAQKDSAKIVEDAKSEAKLLAEQIQDEAKQQGQATLKRTQATLALEKERIVNEAKNELIQLVTLAAEKVTEKSLTSEDKNRLIRKAVKEIEQ